jgi:hypothetical protein
VLKYSNFLYVFVGCGLHTATVQHRTSFSVA